jgi:hypothetical protein
MNTTSLLPERGIFVPVSMIFQSELPAAVLLTWIQLRCLAWKGWHTPAFSIPELASLTGIHPARFQRHLSQLQTISALSIHITSDGKLILAFPEEPLVREQNEVKNQNPVTSIHPNSEYPEMPDQSSYFPDQILGYISYPKEQEQSSNPKYSQNGEAVKLEVESCFLNAHY